MSIAHTLYKLAFLVVLSIVVFSLLTHRMMQSTHIEAPGVVHTSADASHESLLSKLGARVEQRFHMKEETLMKNRNKNKNENGHHGGLRHGEQLHPSSHPPDDPAYQIMVNSVIEKIKRGLNPSSPQYKHIETILNDHNLQDEIKILLQSHAEVATTTSNSNLIANIASNSNSNSNSNLTPLLPSQRTASPSDKGSQTTTPPLADAIDDELTATEGGENLLDDPVFANIKVAVEDKSNPPPSRVVIKTQAPILSPVSSPATTVVKVEKEQKHISLYQAKNQLTSSKELGYEYHPHISPREGSNIDVEHQESLLRCINQSKCIIPDLQLKVKMKVYLCRHPVSQGVRFYFLVKEGLLLHPNVELLKEEEIDRADAIVYLPGSAPWHKTECNKSTYASRFIVLDEFDGYSQFVPWDKETFAEANRLYGRELKWYNMYFKRSFVARKDGLFVNYPHLDKRNLFPISYSLADSYIPHTFNHQREIEIMCTLRGSPQMATRLRVQEWVSEYGKDRAVENIIAGQINGATRTSISKDYFNKMANSRIIVTVNPMNWEGDFRLMESMSTGALVFIDDLFVPSSFPLEHGKHVIFFSNSNKTDLWAKLDYYRANRELTAQIGMNGYLFAMKHHRTVSMADYYLRSFHAGLSGKELEKVNSQTKALKPGVSDLDPSTYSYTGQYLITQAKMQLATIKETNMPGKY